MPWMDEARRTVVFDHRNWFSNSIGKIVAFSLYAMWQQKPINEKR